MSFNFEAIVICFFYWFYKALLNRYRNLKTKYKKLSVITVIVILYFTLFKTLISITMCSHQKCKD